MNERKEKLNIGFKSHTRISSLKNFQNFDIAYNKSFVLVAYIANRFLIDHMLRSARLFANNDFETMVIWGVLAHQNVGHLMPPGIAPEAVLSERGRLESEEKLRPLRLRDVSAITGIPRETTRRKLEAMADKGFVRKTDCGWIVIGERAEPEIREFTKETIMRMVSACDDVLAALKKSDSAAVTRYAA
ncbi:helix-turn-helix domain-containing protein [Comamonas sp. C24C]